MLPLGGVGAVPGDDGPAVVELARGRAAGGEHGLDGQHHAGAQAGAAPFDGVVEDVGGHVHARADAVADVLLEDPQLVALPLGHVRNNGLDGVADRVEAQLASAPLPRRSTGDGGDGLPQGLSGGGVHEPVGLAQVVTADDGGEGGVAVPLGAVLVDDVGAAVEGDQVAVGQDPLTGDAVDDLVVDGDAHGGRVVVVAQEVGVSAGGLDDPG